MSITTILVQFIISAAVVLIYHIWTFERKHAVALPPVVNVTVNPPQVVVPPPQIVVNPPAAPAPAPAPVALAVQAAEPVKKMSSEPEAVAPEILAVIAAAVAVVLLAGLTAFLLCRKAASARPN